MFPQGVVSCLFFFSSFTWSNYAQPYSFLTVHKTFWWRLMIVDWCWFYWFCIVLHNPYSLYHLIAYHRFCFKEADPVAFMTQLKMWLICLCVNRGGKKITGASEGHTVWFFPLFFSWPASIELIPSVGFRPYKTRELVPSVSLISLPPYTASHALFLLQ